MESRTVDYLTGFIALLEQELKVAMDRARGDNTEAARLTDIIRSYREELARIKVKTQPQTPPQPPPKFDADEEKRKEGIRRGQQYNAKRNDFQKWLDEEDAKKAQQQKEDAKPNPQQQDDAWFKEDVRQQEERFRQEREKFQEHKYDWSKNWDIEKDMLVKYFHFMTIIGFDQTELLDVSNLQAWYAQFKKKWPELKRAYYKWLKKNKDGHLHRPGEESDDLVRVMNGIYDHINRKLFPPSALGSILRLMHQRVTLLEAAMRSSG